MNSARLIEIVGRRQTGKTEKMVWFTAGAIMAGARAVIVARTSADASQIRKRLATALHMCGDTEAFAHADAAVIATIDPEAARGSNFVIREVDLD